MRLPYLTCPKSTMSGTTLSTLAASASLTVRRYLRSVNSNIFVWQTLREARAEWDIVWRSGAVPNTVEGLAGDIP